jgi:succinate dehydrogenase/fumarate reductase flavoprotein subunit
MAEAGKWDCDVLVIGSGAAGMCAAITAKVHGLNPVIVEKSPVFGGSTAVSGGVAWIPGSPVAARAGVKDSPEEVRRYLRKEVGNHYDNDKMEVYLTQGPRMVDFLETHSALRFQAIKWFPDYHPNTPGSARGRPIRAANYDLRELGDHAAKLRQPLPELTLFGGMMIAGEDVPHLLNMTRSFGSFRHATRMVLRHAADKLRFGRSMRVVNGNAMAARLGKTVFDLGIPLWLSSPARRLLIEEGRVVGAEVERDGSVSAVRARLGVVLASGGFPHDLGLLDRVYPHAKPLGHYTVVPGTSDGDGIRLGQAAGGTFNSNGRSAAVWMPVSLNPQPGGGVRHVPHMTDRNKPGFIAVNQHGKRFVSEAVSYQDFVEAMQDQVSGGGELVVWLIAGHAAARKYGIGAAFAAPMPIGRHLKSGYLRRAPTLAALAAEIGVDAAALEATVERYNRFAADGQDPDFNKGGDDYQRFMGDAAHKPNPNVGPLGAGPYYAVRLHPGDVGTMYGLNTDAHARVVDGNGQPIPGLFAAGNDAASVMAGTYPGGGTTLGPGLTFGYVAGLTLAGKPLDAGGGPTI